MAGGLETFRAAAGYGRLTYNAAGMGIAVEHEPCVNYSLIHSGLQHVIRSVSIPWGAQGLASLSGFTRAELHLPSGVTRDVSPLLDTQLLAELSQPARTQLLIRATGGAEEVRPVTVLPLRAWDQRRECARATAAFVLENDPFVLRALRKAEVSPSPSEGPRPARQVLGRIYGALTRSFEVCYLYDRGVLVEYHSEQYVRFPSQMHWDVGGTCIDFVLLLAAILCAAGLRPVIVLLGDEYGDRHALAGLWVEPVDTCPAVLAGEFLRQEVAGGRLLALEATGLTQDSSFEEALEEGRRRALADRILWGVDVTAARSQVPPVDPLPESAQSTFLSGLPARITDAYTATRTLEAASLLPALSLEVVSSRHPADLGQRWTLRGFAVRIGKTPHNQVRLNDFAVSREHAVLFLKDGTVFVKDLGSRWGTAVAGVALEPHTPQAVSKGQTIRIGAVELRLAGN